MSVVEDTLKQMAGEDSDETRGWDDGIKFGEALKKGIQNQLDLMRRWGATQAYIDAWKASAESIFYDMTKEDTDGK